MLLFDIIYCLSSSQSACMISSISKPLEQPEPQWLEKKSTILLSMWNEQFKDHIIKIQGQNSKFINRMSNHLSVDGSNKIRRLSDSRKNWANLRLSPTLMWINPTTDSVGFDHSTIFDGIPGNESTSGSDGWTVFSISVLISILINTREGKGSKTTISSFWIPIEEFKKSNRKSCRRRSYIKCRIRTRKYICIKCCLYFCGRVPIFPYCISIYNCMNNIPHFFSYIPMNINFYPCYAICLIYFIWLLLIYVGQ